MTADIWRDGGNGRFTLSFAAALFIEIAALTVLVPLLAHPTPPASPPAPIRLTITAPPTPVPPAPPPPKPLPPLPKPTPPQPAAPPLPMALPLPLPLPPPPAAPTSRRAAPHRAPPRHLVAPPISQPQTAPAAAPPPAATTAAAPPSPNQLAAFEAALHRAVQAALIFPDAAQMAHESGIVRLRFRYLDGNVSNISIVRSCGFPMLDAAAVQTAHAARYPPPPADLAGRIQLVDVDVVFPLATTSEDPD